MYSNYRLITRSSNKGSEIKLWNGSTRINKKSLAEDPYKSIRQTPDIRGSNFRNSESPSNVQSVKDMSIDKNSRNRSFVQLDTSAKKINKVNIRSGKLKSLAFRQDLDRKYKVPNFVSTTLIEIFVNTSKEPVGLGVLVASKLMMTSYIGMPNDRFATRCIFRFICDKAYYRPRVDKFFYSSVQYNISVVAISRVRKDTKKQYPIRVDQVFDIKLGDILFCAENTCFRVQVSNLEQDSFGITSYFTPLTGCPIFTSSWNLVGICHTTSMTYKYTECTNLSNIFQILAYIRSIYNFEISPIKIERNLEYKETKDLKWFEFGGEYIEIFTLESSEWKYNRSDLEIMWQCAPVSINDEETFLVGGIKKELAVDEVYKYNSRTNEIYAKACMGVARSSCCAAFYDNLVFAIGGKYASTFCEKYIIEEDRWEYIPSMLHERYDFSAVVLNHTIYIIGGEPRRFIGDSIEKYDILREMWEEVPTRLPYPIACPPLCVIDNYTCGILGGRGSRLAMIMEVSRYQSNDVSIKEGAELSEEIESIYQAAYSRTQNKIFILNTAEGFARPILYKVHCSYLPL